MMIVLQEQNGESACLKIIWFLKKITRIFLDYPSRMSENHILAPTSDVLVCEKEHLDL